MKELRDIKTKKGDIIYFENGDTEAVNCLAENFSHYKQIEDYYSEKIIKIERPVKYETIYEAPKQILDKEEKEYLENVIRPFKDKVIDIIKYQTYNREEYIVITIKAGHAVCLPSFDADSMYRRMKLNKNYTIKELGLFEGEE